MQAYFDKDLNIWVFPGEDPQEKAKPIGPPPTLPATPVNPSKSDAVPSGRPVTDPLAAMMAPPPSRIPSSLGRPGRPGSGQVSASPKYGSPPPQFAVFQPPAGGSSD
jgi:hypothetical protein